MYCLCRERWFPDGEAAFSIDHLHPQISAPDRRTEYNNLLYTCCQCNAVRGASPVSDPCEYAYGQLLRVLEDGFVEALTSRGRELVEISRLNRPHLVTFRRGMMDVIATLLQRKDTGADELIRHYLGFPISLPNHCTGQKIKIADIVDKYDALAPLTHSRAASGSRAAPLACLVDLRGCFESDQIHSEKHSWLGVYVFLYESVSDTVQDKK